MKPQWDIHTPLELDELLSSWLVRAALAQGCDPLVLTEKIWGKWRVWTTDVDRTFDSKRLTPLSTNSGVNLTQFKQASIFPIASKITGTTPKKNNIWPWILALGVRNRKHRNRLQFCPLCLLESKNPYYKKQWRLAWHTVCDEHHCLLLDQCHLCNSPVEPHRLLAENKHITLCATCKADLRKAKAHYLLSSNASFQRMTDQALLVGHGKYHNQKLSIPDWFKLAGFFLAMIRRAHNHQSKPLLNVLHPLNAIIASDLTLTPYRLELLSTIERHYLFASLYKLMSCNRDQFEHLTLEAKITRQAFCSAPDVLPEVLKPLYVNLKDNSRKYRGRNANHHKYRPRQPYVVKRMAIRLERKLKMISI